MPDASYSELLTAKVQVDTSDFQAKMKLADLSVAAFIKTAGITRLFRGEREDAESITAYRKYGETPGDETHWFTRFPVEALDFAEGGNVYAVDVPDAAAADYRAPGGSYLVPGTVAAKATRVRDRTNSEVGVGMLMGAVEGVRVFAERVMVSSLGEVPEASGHLRDSHNVGSPKRSGKKVGITLGYGYGSSPSPVDGRLASQYAVPVHEIYRAEHVPPTKDHYLLDPLLEHSAEFGAGVASFMRLAAEGQTTAILGGAGHSATITSLRGFKTGVPAIGGGVSFRGGSPLNRGQFSRRPE